jgi:hypothetical protein
MIVIKGVRGNPSEFYTDLKVDPEGNEYRIVLDRRKAPAKLTPHPVEPIQHLTGYIPPGLLWEKGDIEEEVFEERPKRVWVVRNRKPREYGQTLY